MEAKTENVGLGSKYSVWDIENMNESDTVYVGWRIFLLHHSNCYAYFRIFKVMEDTLMEEITELKGINKKLKYSLRKDKTNWLGEIPCFKTSCLVEYYEGYMTMRLPFGLNDDVRAKLNEYSGFNEDDETNDSGSITFDALDKQIEEMNKNNEKLKKQEEPPKKEEPQEEPKQELTEISKTYEKEMNVFLQQLHNASEMFKGEERDSIILGLINLQVEKNMLKLRGHLLDKLKEEIKEKMGYSEFFEYMPE